MQAVPSLVEGNALEHPRARVLPRVLSRALLCSLLLHLGGGLAWSLIAPGHPEQPGQPAISDLDLDLVAPRLAPPLRGEGWGSEAEGRAGDRGDSVPAGASASSGDAERSTRATDPALGASPLAESALERAIRPPLSESALERAARSPLAQAQASPTPVPQPPLEGAAHPPLAKPARAEVMGLENPSAAEDRERHAVEPPAAPSVDPAPLPVTLARVEPQGLVPLSPRAAESAAQQPAAAREPEKASHGLAQLYAESDLPAAPPPEAVVAAVREDLVRRQALSQQLAEQRRKAQATAEQRLAALDAEARAGSAQSGSGLGARGSGLGAGGGRRRRGRGGGAGYGLRFYLAGQRVASTRVVNPPEPIALPTVHCRVSRLGIPPATVRMLVGKDGAVGLAYLKHSSSNGAFDACALDHAKAIRFQPGEDEAGRPLAVWIHLRVEPSLLSSAAIF